MRARSIRGDVMGGVLAGIVTLPVALSMGSLAGLGPVAGIYGAVVVGAIAALFGGTRGLISGPNSSVAFAISVIVVDFDDRLGAAVTVALLAGFMQVALGSLKLGYLLSYTPYSVTSGLLSGIGVLVVASQVLPLVGTPPEIGGLVTNARLWPGAIAELDLDAFAIGAATFAVATFWPKRLSHWFPSTAAAMSVGTLLGVVWLSGAPVLGEISLGLPDLAWPSLDGEGLLRLVPGAVTVAVLGSIDALVGAQIADSVTGSEHKPNREVVAQGLGNIGAGLAGGVPGSSSFGLFMNVEAGGRSPLAGLICAGTVLLLAEGLGDVIQVLPDAVLAAILLRIGLDLIDWRIPFRLARAQREHALVLVVTFGVTVFFDLVTALVIGMAAAGLANARSIERLELDSVVSVPLLDHRLSDDDPESAGPDSFSARVGLVELRGTFTTASANKLTSILRADINEHEVVIVDFSRTSYLDDSAAMVVERLFGFARSQGTPYIVSGLSGQPQRCLAALGILRIVPKDRVVPAMDEALLAARKLLQDRGDLEE